VQLCNRPIVPVPDNEIVRFHVLQGCSIVAKPKNTKLPAPSAPKTRVSFTIDAGLYRRFRIAAAESDMTESQLFEWLVTELLSGVHSRGVPDRLRLAAGQGSGSEPFDPPATVSIPRSSATITNRIGAIVRSSGMPVDDALECLCSDPDQR